MRKFAVFDEKSENSRVWRFGKRLMRNAAATPLWPDVIFSMYISRPELRDKDNGSISRRAPPYILQDE